MGISSSRVSRQAALKVWKSGVVGKPNDDDSEMDARRLLLWKMIYKRVDG